MAYVTAVTIGTSNKVSVDYQSQEVNVSVTFQLERTDGDLVSFVEDKAAEVERAHSGIWRRIRELRAERKAQEATERANGQAADPAPEPRPAPDPWPAGPAPAQPRAERPSRRRKAEPEVAAAVNGRANGATVHAAAALEPAASNGAVAVTEAPPPTATETLATMAPQRAILSLANRATLTDEGLAELLGERFGKSRLEELTKHEAAQLLMELQRGDRR